jgi:YidC/Oxa1 family membrane protein insertase
MNRRFFVALLLTGMVMVITPMFFSRTPRTVPAVSDTTRETPPPRTDSLAVVPPTGGAAPVIDSTARADTARIATERLSLGFSSIGGALISAELPRYRRLGTDSGAVQLARSGEALLRFAVAAGADTLGLAETALQTEVAGNVVTFRGDLNGFPAEVRWSFAPDTYRVKVNGVEQPIGYMGKVDVRVTGLGPGAYLIAELPPGFRSTEADSSTDFSHLAYAFKPAGASADLIRFGSLDPGERDLRRGPHDWVVAKSKYFLLGIIADTAARIAELDVQGVPRTWRMATSGKASALIPMKGGAVSFEVYIGPLDPRLLPAVGREFETANPYGGWMQGIVQPFATIVMKALLKMKDITELNYGYVLIIFGILIRVVLWPLNQVAMRSSLRMQRIQPELAAAQKKYAKDPEKARTEMMRIYREHGMSPLSPLSGCLPLLIPMPVLFALFFVFQNTIEFRGVSFWWMPDISNYDPLFIIPAVMVVSMFVLQWIGMRNAPPNPQAKIMLYFLPIMMGVFLFKFAAGLNLYYAAQNIAALPQQWLIANERAKSATRKT